MKVCIVTEGNKELGLGHIIRCLSLYKAFEKKGIKPIFFSPKNSSVKKILSEINYYPIDWIKNPEKFLKKILDSDVVIIDSTLAPLSLYKKIANISKISVFLDDYQRINYPKGILINRALNAKEFKYPNNGSVYLLGTNYLPMPSVFWQTRKKVIRDNIENILITFGGSDPRHMSAKVLRLITNLYPNVTKTVLIGIAHGKDSQIYKAGDKNTVFYFHPNEEKLKGIMQNADIAISAAGQTLYELARMGIPTIAVKVADNQNNNIKGLVKSGFLDYGGEYNSKEVYKNIERLIKKLNNKKIRSKKSNIGKKLVDGHGSIRIVNFLIKMSREYEK